MTTQTIKATITNIVTVGAFPHWGKGAHLNHDYGDQGYVNPTSLIKVNRKKSQVWREWLATNNEQAGHRASKNHRFVLFSSQAKNATGINPPCWWNQSAA
ncbi:hypothetical protein LLY61_003009 [Escherichia coli]|nr:hypothetical protein [Escherichia coli]